MAEGRFADRPAEFREAVWSDIRRKKLNSDALLEKYPMSREELAEARASVGRRHSPRKQVNRRQIIRRLFGLLDRMLAKIEAQMKDVGENEVNILGRLVQSMGKLIDIEARGGSAVTPRETRDMHNIRSKLIARIDELKRS